MVRMDFRRGIERPTLALIGACYAVWAMATLYAGSLSLWIAVPVTALAIAFHSSLQHETLHGHPLPDQRASDALVFPAIGLAIPYRRFRDTHLAHHRNELLTDPYDDPESNYLDPKTWVRLPVPLRWLLVANNTLLGRIVFGPAIGLFAFYRGDWRLVRAGDGAVIRAWLLHLAGLMPVALWLSVATMPLWAYLVCVYAGLSLLKIRTFLEHRADEKASGRSVIVEDRGPLALLFLNNNYHAVHHAHPQVAWYDLPGFYRARREEWLRRNGGYRYGSYGEVFRAHLLRTKDPVAHPLMDAE